MPAHPSHSPLPRFSVLVANYNHAALVTRAVDSVLAQDYPADLREVIVTDDGSTDDSLARLARYDGRSDVQVVAQPNRGQTAAYAAALARARGDYVCLLDADDLCSANKLAVLAQTLQDRAAVPETLFLCHDLEILDGADGQAIDASWFEQIGQARFGDHLHVSVAHHFFPFSVTSGMVFGRTLLQRLMDDVPQWEWPMGSDALLGHAAMVVVGEVHYLRQVLGSYVVHAGNNFASIVDGRFRQKPVWHGRWPKKLRFLELLLDSLDLDEHARADRLGYLSRVEHAVRSVPSSRRHPQPLLSFVVDATGPATERHQRATVQALAALRHSKHESVWLLDAGSPQPLLPSSLPGEVVHLPEGSTDYARLRAGFRQTRGSYLCFLQAGDCPDPRFTERHLQAHRYGSLPMLTVCDLRLLGTDGEVLHAGIQGTAAGWGGVSAEVPAFGHLLRDWPLAPLPATVFRRSAFVEAFFGAEALPLAPRRAGWLLAQYLVQTGGATRLAENLVDLQLPPAATANASWLSQFIDRHGPLPAPDLAAAAEAMFAAHARVPRSARAYLSDAWEVRFLRWLLQSGGAEMPARLARLAQQSGDAAWAARVTATLRQLAAKP
jgi:glycosyltransferase involved in cell wall biosynthesis